MTEPLRRHRSSAKTARVARVIRPYEFDDRYLPVLSLLEPYCSFKYLTIPWLHFFCRPEVEYSTFRKYLGYLRQEPNSYIRCPEQQLASPNVPYKTLVYELGERGLKLLQDRGLAPVRDLSAKRARAHALHRAHSYYHEVIVDLGYFAPLRHLALRDPNVRVVHFADLLVHDNVPMSTRTSTDPLLVSLSRGQTRFDGTPHVIVRSRDGYDPRSIGIPGIEVDRGTETFERVEAHIRNAVEYVANGHGERLWGFDNCMIPFLFTSEVRKARAMSYLKSETGPVPYLLFKAVPDIGLLRHFPTPQEYDGVDLTERVPATIHLFTTPWQRVGFPDFSLNTFEERP